MTRTHNVLALGPAVLMALSLTAFNTHYDPGEANTAVSFDTKRAAEIFDGKGSESVPLSDFLRATLTVTNDGDPVALVLFAFELKEGRTISSFESRPFTPPTGPWLLPSDYLPGDQFLEERYVTQESVITTKKAVPFDVGVAEPGKFVINGVFANKPAGWESMNAFYFIVAPVDAKGSGQTIPAALFVMTDPMGDH